MEGHQQLTIQLPLPDAEFAKRYATRNHISVSDLFDRFIQKLKWEEENPIDPGIKALEGILPPDTDFDAERMEYFTRKHLSGESND